jgi:hypothetical protein
LELIDQESPEGARIGAKGGFFFLVTLLTVVMVVLPVLYAVSSVDSDQDTSPPDTQISAGPSGTVDYRDVTFRWTGWDDTTPASQLEYSFNLQGYDTGWSDWASATTKHYAALRGGSYIFRVQARDQAGNVDPAPAETVFYVSWSFAVLTDLHVGNGISDYDGPGYDDSGTPVSGEAAGYAQDAVNEINKIADSQNIAFVAVLGDLTDSAEASELRAAKLILDNLTVPWIPVMGNHDTWPMTDDQLAPLRNPPPESYFDSIMGPEYSNLASEMSGWGKESPALVYDPEAERDTYFENFFFDYGGFHFVYLDFNSRLGYRAGDLHDFAGGTWSWFRQHMEQFVQQNPERSRDVILLAHHPMTGDGSDNGTKTFTSTELDEISNFTNNTYYSYIDSSGITQTRSYASRTWGQLAGHKHPWRLQVDYPAWSNGGPVITYPRNFGGVSIGFVKVTSDTPDGVDYWGPTVATEVATSISPISATLNGHVVSRGTAASVQVSFEWGLTTGYGNYTTPQTIKAGSFSASISGLTPDATYHFRAKAVGDGIVWGEDMTFTTPNRAPLVTTNDASSITTDSAWLNGNLTSLGTAGSVTVSFEWGTTSGGPYPNKTIGQVMTGAEPFSFDLGSLTPGITYYYQAKAVGNGTSYGAESSFPTRTTPPSVTTNDATSVTTTSATLNGNLASLGTADDVTVSFLWKVPGGSYTPIAAGLKNSVGTFSVDVTGLTPGTTYYFRARAVGDGTSHGADNSFTTATTPPVATTNNASSITTNSARLNGTLTSLGTAGSVTVSFEWGTTSRYGAETSPQSMSGTGNMSANLTGISASTTYHFRVKVVGDGAVYGDDVTFTTGSAADTTAPPISVVTSSDSTAPAISVVTFSDITVSGVTIAWTTNEAATSQVEYGLTAEYGLSATIDTSLANSHRVELTRLEAGKTYHYRVKSKDASNNQAVSADDTFTTAAHSGEKPTWALVLIGLVAAVGLGGAVSYQRADMYQGALLRRLDEAMGRVNLLERERNEATAKLQSMERDLNELKNLISLAKSKADEILKGGPAPDVSKGQVTPKAQVTSAPLASEELEGLLEPSASQGKN